MARSQLSRRDWHTLVSAGVVGYSCSGWLQALADETANNPQRRRACILLWMNGGPSQTDTFDLKPGNANGGPFRETQTSVPGIRISEHLPRLAQQMQDMARPTEVTNPQLDARVSILEDMERDFAARHPGVSPTSHRTAYDRAVRLMRTSARAAFNLEEEPAQIRDGYGRNLFGQGC